MKEFGVWFITDILKICKKLTFIPNSKDKPQKFYISIMLCIKIHWFTLYSLLRVSIIKTGLEESTNSNFVLVMDVITKQDSKLNGTVSQLIQKQSNKLPQLLLIKPSNTMDLLTEPFRSLKENSMESKNSQFRDGSN